MNLFRWKPREKIATLGASGGQGAGGSGLTTGGSATVYEPKNQSHFDTSFSTGLDNLFSGAGTGIGTNAYSDLYPSSLYSYQNYLDPGYGGYATSAATGATDAAATAASDYYKGTYPLLTGSVKGLGDYADTALGSAKTLPAYSTQVAADAFDPQGLRYDRERQKVGDYANVANAQAGLGSSPYGASVTAGALKDFDIDWQNNQLKREASGASTLSSLANTYGAYGKDATAGYEGLGNIGYGAGSGLDTLSYDPYKVGSTVGSNAITGAGSTASIGNKSYGLLEDALKYAEDYLSGGRSASGLSNTIGSTGFNQTASEIGGGLSGANALFGSNGLFSGSSGGSGLFGTTVADYGGGGELGIASSLGDATTYLPGLSV